MDISQYDMLAIIAQQVPDFTPVADLQKIEDGNLNHVWRLCGKERSLIIKYAPPYIAANPEVPLNPNRISFEANVLSQFNEGQPLSSLATEQIRPPRLYHFDEEKHLLIEEDFGKLPDISEALQKGSIDPTIGKNLGIFVGNLHRETYKKDEYRQSFKNTDIQQTRLEVQYKSAADYTEKISDVAIEEIKDQTIRLGNELLQPGRCLIMGDLWPPSLLVDNNNLRIIDWEFVHFGRPLQDVAHFAAHCWMQAHGIELTSLSKKFELLWYNFWKHYKQTLGPKFADLFDEQEDGDAATHAGAEILIRTTGAFKTGYVYEEYENTNPKIHHAIQKARKLILSDSLSTIFE